MNWKSEVRKIVESVYFMAVLAIYTVFCYALKLEYAAYFGLLLSCILMLIVDSSFVAAPNLWMLFVGSTLHEVPSLKEVKTILVLTLVLVAFGIAFYKLYKKRKAVLPRLKKNYVLYSMTALFIAMWISLVNTPTMLQSIYYTVFFGVNILVYLVVLFTTDPTEENKDKMLLSMMTLVLVLAAEMTITYFRDLKGLEQPFIQLLKTKRIGVSWTNINHMTTVLLMGLIACVFYFLKHKEVEHRIPTMLIFAVGYTAFFLTNCRGAVLGALVSIPVILYAFIRFKSEFKNEIPYLIVSILWIGLTIFLFIKLDYFNRLDGSGFSNLTWNGRLKIYDIAYTNFKNHWFIGTGYGSSHYYIDQVLQWNIYFYHNEFLQIASTVGVIGFGLFIFYLVSCVRESIPYNIYGAFLLCVLLYMLGQGFVDTVFFHDKTMPFFSIVLSLGYMNKKQKNVTFTR